MPYLTWSPHHLLVYSHLIQANFNHHPPNMYPLHPYHKSGLGFGIATWSHLVSSTSMTYNHPTKHQGLFSITHLGFKHSSWYLGIQENIKLAFQGMLVGQVLECLAYHLVIWAKCPKWISLQLCFNAQDLIHCLRTSHCGLAKLVKLPSQA